MKIHRICLVLSILTASFAGCSHFNPEYNRFTPGAGTTNELTQVVLTNRLNPAWLIPPTNYFTLGPGDRVEIEILGETNSTATTIVAPDGKLYYNLLPGIDVWGLSMSQAKAAMERELARFVRATPQIQMTLRAVESKRFWILGRVQAPGVYPITAPMTLLEAIASAGGTMTLSNYRDQEAAGVSEELADLRRSFIVRQGSLLPVDFVALLQQGDVSQNIYIEPDDFIYLPAATAREVYVLGAVVQPQRVAFQDGMTVAGAIASCFGTLNGAYTRHVAVVRGSLQNPQVAVVDYRNVIRGEAQDITLQPHDIVYVPFSPYRYLHRYAELIVNTFVSSAAINAGTSLFENRPAGSAGIFIPVGSGIQVIPPTPLPPMR